MKSSAARAVVAISLLLVIGGCPGGNDGIDEDLGPIEDTLSFADRINWPGVDRATGRVVQIIFGFAEGTHINYWFFGFAAKRTADSFWFCRDGDELCPLDEHHRLNWDRLIGQPLFTRIPGQLEFSPFWQMWKVTVPADYQPDEIKSVATLNGRVNAGEISVNPLITDFGVHFGEPVGFQETVLHCALVLAGTTLDRNGTEMPDGSGPMMMLETRAGWHEGYQIHFVDFSQSEGVFPEAVASENRPQMRFANIYIPWRRCNGDPTGICALPGTIADRRPVSERGLGEDITGDGDAEDANNTFAAAPCRQPLRASEPSYSPLWAVNNAFVEPESTLMLIDTSDDQTVSDIKSAPDVFAAIEQGGVTGPVPSMEDETGNPVPGNDGQVFFNCPFSVPADHIPFPCGDQQ